MSLISARNLVAPLTNMVHIITILLVAVCFAVLRLTGAGLSVKSASEVGSYSNYASRNTEVKPIIEANEAGMQKNSITSTINLADQDNINEREIAESSDAKSRSLAEIEKSLGIK